MPKKMAKFHKTLPLVPEMMEGDGSPSMDDINATVSATSLHKLQDVIP